MALEIKVLGSLVIESGYRRLETVPRSARGLLAYLAVQGEKPVSRERVIDLLWPKRAWGEAHGSLRNCLWVLRKTLGESGARHLATDVFTCHLRDVRVDLERFEQLSRSLHRSERSAAAELYRGEFLSDLYIPSEPFQEWLTAERERTLNLVCAVLQRLTDDQLAVDEYDAAVQSASRLVALNSLSETGHRALMRTYARAGRRLEALRQYKRCVEILRREGIAPDAETDMLAQEIASSGGTAGILLKNRGYEFPDHRVLPHTLVRPSEDKELKTLVQSVPGETSAQWPCLLPRVLVAVAPLRNLTGDRNQQYLVDSLTDDLVTDLRPSGPGLSFVRVMDDRGSVATPLRVVEPDVEYVISGSVRRSGAGTHLVRMQIMEAATAECTWAGRFRVSPETLRSFQTKFTRTLSRELRILLLAAAARRGCKGFGVSLAASDCLARAAKALSGQMRAELTAEAQQWFLTALADDPHNVDALVGVARTCQHIVGQPWWANSREVAISSDLGRDAISIALSLTPGHAGAQCVKGMLCSETGRLDEAANMFEGALAMDPRMAVAQGFGGYNMAFLGHAEATLPAVERAMRLDHTDRRRSIFLFFGGFGELLLGRTEVAIALFEKSLESNLDYGAAQLFLIAARSLIGRQDEAVRAAASFRERYPDYRSYAFEQLWLSRSVHPTYRAQMKPLFEKIRASGALD